MTMDGGYIPVVIVTSLPFFVHQVASVTFDFTEGPSKIVPRTTEELWIASLRPALTLIGPNVDSYQFFEQPANPKSPTLRYVTPIIFVSDAQQ